MRKLVLICGAALLAAGTTAMLALAGHEPGTVASITGCLSNGKLKDLAVGESPATPCAARETLVHLSGGDITAVAAGPGLTDGGSTGAVGLGVDFAGPGSATSAARSDHTHDAAAITSGTLALARIPQGPGSGLNADILDGQEASAFLPATGKAADSDLLDGLDSSAFLTKAIYNYRSVTGAGRVRAFCLPGETVAGGGGFAHAGGTSPFTALIESYPISDATGAFATGTTAIGWQVAREDFGVATTFVVCVS